MDVTRYAVPAAILIASLTQASAQSTVQELIDAGGTRPGREEVESLAKGKTMVGRDWKGEFTLKDDGSGWGWFEGQQGAVGTWGKWWLSKHGHLCFEFRSQWGEFPRNCNGVYKLGNDTFLAPRGGRDRIESPPEAKLFPRRFK